MSKEDLGSECLRGESHSVEGSCRWGKAEKQSSCGGARLGGARPLFSMNEAYLLCHPARFECKIGRFTFEGKVRVISGLETG